MSNFHPLAVVGRESETQLQVGENELFNARRIGYYQRFNGPNIGMHFFRSLIIIKEL